MNERVPTTASAHASHDLTFVAALAARSSDLTDTDRAAARDQIASCDACTDLLADLFALQVALPTTSTPPRPREFTLDPADAERLRAGGWRRVLGLFGSARDSVTRPLAVGLATLGFAGLVVATLPSVLPTGGGTAGAPASAPVEQNTVDVAAAPAASAAAAAASAAPSSPRPTEPNDWRPAARRMRAPSPRAGSSRVPRSLTPPGSGTSPANPCPPSVTTRPAYRCCSSSPARC